MILAVDTSSEYGSLALVEGANVREEVLLHSPEGFSSILFGEIQAMLERCSIRLEEVQAFAAAAGPGSFTGVRVGLSAIKGLAGAAGRPAFGISTLQALAFFGSARLRATVLDAHRGEVYGAVYDDLLRPVLPETVGKIGSWLSSLPAEDVEVISPDFDALGGLAPFNLYCVRAPRALASAIARIAFQRLSSGDPGDPALIDANYVRRADADIFWKEPKGT